MSLLAAGQFQVNQAQAGLGAAAERETSRNIANKNLKEQEEAGKASLGATVGGVVGGALGSYFGPAGTAAGSTLGSIAGGFASKLF